MGRMVRGSNPGGARFSALIQTSSGANSVLYTIGTGPFPRVKRSGRGVDHPPTYSAEVKERVELYLYSTSGPLWPVLGRLLPNKSNYKHCQIDPVLYSFRTVHPAIYVYVTMTNKTHNLFPLFVSVMLPSTCFKQTSPSSVGYFHTRSI
jgi:hypothetical protein